MDGNVSILRVHFFYELIYRKKCKTSQPQGCIVQAPAY